MIIFCVKSQRLLESHSGHYDWMNQYLLINRAILCSMLNLLGGRDSDYDTLEDFTYYIFSSVIYKTCGIFVIKSVSKSYPELCQSYRVLGELAVCLSICFGIGL